MEVRVAEQEVDHREALERIGVPLDWAVNVPSALGFFLLIVSIYLFFAQNLILE